MADAAIGRRAPSPQENPIFALRTALEGQEQQIHVRKVDSSGVYFAPRHHAVKARLTGDEPPESAANGYSPLRTLSAPFRKMKMPSSMPTPASKANGLHTEPKLEEKPPDARFVNGHSGSVEDGEELEEEEEAVTMPANGSAIDQEPGSPISDSSSARFSNGDAPNGRHGESETQHSPGSPPPLTISTDLAPMASTRSPDGFLALPMPSGRSPSPNGRNAAVNPLVGMRRANTVGSSAVLEVPMSPNGAPKSFADKRTRGPQRTQSYGSPLMSPLVQSEADNPEAQFQDSVAKQADAIRKERAEKRLEKEKNDEREAKEREKAAQPRAATPLAEKVLKGNIIGEDHVNYVLMYNMLTGIRIGVSRCQAKPARPLVQEDYTARHKFSFDIVGNELTPSAKYDFKFKDYAPWVFRDLREHFYLDPADYLVSLTAKYILSELGSPGKSGSFFYFSRDYHYIIKTIAHSEHKFLLSILREYHAHIKSNPHTLLSRFYGLHRVKLPRGRKIHFVIMNNIFPPHRDIHETYDLKGSSQGREYPEEKARDNPGAVLKDLNWVKRNRRFEFGPEKRAFFEEQLKRDTELLQKLKIMDYSLLVGLHDMSRGNRDNLREQGLTTFQPETGKLRRRTTQQRQERDATALRQAVQSSDPQALSITNRLPDKDRSERKHFIFYQDEGGLRATGEDNEPLPQLYYLGIIDILTPYTLYKRFEHFGKSFKHDGDTISAVPPMQYGSRFMRFIFSSIRGEDISQRPKMVMI